MISPQFAIVLGFIGVIFSAFAVLAAILAWNWTGVICLAVGSAMLFLCFTSLH